MPTRSIGILRDARRSFIMPVAFCC